MCGLIAFLNRPIDAALVRAVGRRGPHGHGWAHPDPSGVATAYFGGPITPDTAPVTAGWLLGHSRLATSTNHHGTLPDPAEGQPITNGTITLAHNGHAPLEGPRAPHDSWAILDLLATRGPDGLDPALFGGHPQAALFIIGAAVFAWRLPGRHRPAHPLFVGDRIATSVPAPQLALLPDGITQLQSEES